MDRRIVITGIGAVAPGGIGTKEFWALLTAGRTATRALSLFDAGGFRSRVAAECDFDPLAKGLSAEQVARLDRAAQFAVVAMGEAITDAGLEADTVAPERLGVSLGSAVGATMSLEREFVAASSSGREWTVDHTKVRDSTYDYFVPSSMAAELAWLAGAEGPVRTISTGCTSGIDSIGHACELLREGSADVMIAGAADAPISPITVACFDAIKATTPRNDEAETASRPFDNTRNGFVLGEGSAVLVLETLDGARARGAHVYAEIAGYGTRCNAYHMTGLRPDGRELAEAATRALAQARIDPSDVDYVNAHGSGTKQNDRHETAAVKRGLGEHAHRVPMSSIKSMIGHSLGAIGSIEIAACALAIEHGVIPPTANLTESDPVCDLDYVPLTARQAGLDAVLSLGSGFGGFQSAMVLRRLRDGAQPWAR